jgi:hypothetical protein
MQVMPRMLKLTLCSRGYRAFLLIIRLFREQSHPNDTDCSLIVGNETQNAKAHSKNR